MNTTHFAGGVISLNCSARGFPSPAFVWYKNGEPIPEIERAEISNSTLEESLNEIITQSTLSLFNLNRSDDADYFCEAHNLGVYDSVFVVMSSLAHLTVQCEH